MEEILKSVNIKKVGNISMIVAFSVLTFYVLSSYKTYLEIVKLKREEQ